MPIQDNPLEYLSQKRLIFTVTTGRSGTQFLTRILRLIPQAVSVHEPKPSFAKVMRLVQQHQIDPAAFLINEKLPQISCLLKERQANLYVETSHLFCKGFLEPTLGLGLVPDLIWLKRSSRAVAMSMYRLQTIPGRSSKGLKYYLSPDDPGVLQLPNWKELHDYQLCYWYCLETERRATTYIQMIEERGGRTAETTIQEIKSLSGFVSLHKALNLPFLTPLNWLRFLKRRNQTANTKQANKEQQTIPASQLDDLEREIINMLP